MPGNTPEAMTKLRHLGRKRGRELTAELLERFELTEAARKPVSTYSGGMRRRLDLAMTLVGTPRLIFLDEPTTGLDPRSHRTMWDIIRRLVNEGTTIFLTTQYLDEADELADRIAILDGGSLDGGRLVAEGTASELKRGLPGGHLRLTFADHRHLTAAANLLSQPARDEDLTIDVPGTEPEHVRQMLNQLHDAGISVDDVSVHTPDLDDVFFALTGRQNKEEVPAT
jgi:ABC-2 type transport system ATP-binding protein